MRRNQRIGADFSILLRRRHHNDLRHARHLRRHNIHQDGRRIDRLPARYIDTDSSQRQYLLAKQNSILAGVKPAVPFLFFVKGADVFKRLPDDAQQLLRDLTVRFPDLRVRYTDCVRRQLHLVKFLRISEKGFISVRPDLLHNLPDRSLVRSIIRTVPAEKISKHLTPRLFIQSDNSHDPAPPEQHFLHFRLLQASDRPACAV